ncbi:MAG TPA: diguanylate cyclase [Pyrinomonadaceae bacterium]|nr:diguanylate cyclase [Pyrinomonadaceae bacterium]
METRTRAGQKERARDRGRVLFVGGDPAVTRHAASLEAAGFFVGASEGGAKALLALQRTRPHVVVLDAALTGISAAELVRMLNDAQDAVPVVLVGRPAATLERRAEALAAGAADYFELPREEPLLAGRVGQLVKHRLELDRLRSEADRDYLTGLANRRRFRRAISQEVERWRRYKLPCALLLLDVDFLKKVNDAHGHPAGDRVIRFVASAITELSRDNDTAARLGGEEFALLLAGTDLPNARAAGERLRESVASEPLDEIGTVTISVGVAACPSSAVDERELFAVADAALYRAKRAGRNRSVVAGGDEEEQSQCDDEGEGLTGENTAASEVN